MAILNSLMRDHIGIYPVAMVKLRSSLLIKLRTWRIVYASLFRLRSNHMALLTFVFAIMLRPCGYYVFSQV